LTANPAPNPDRTATSAATGAARTCAATAAVQIPLFAATRSSSRRREHNAGEVGADHHAHLRQPIDEAAGERAQQEHRHDLGEDGSGRPALSR